jgi:hypothetical protein
MASSIHMDPDPVEPDWGQIGYPLVKMDLIAWIVGRADLFLIAPYRWPGNPVAGWWLGTSMLAVWATVLGEITVALAFRANRSYVREVAREMSDRHDQSINALKAGDKDAYRAINKLANEAYGRTFFLQVAMGASSLWPVPFALAWLQTRFSGVDFFLPLKVPIIGDSVTYPFIFLPLYVLARIVFGKVKRLLLHPS